ncbi:MAG: MoxR family ATPase [Oscillospiraceae bacterium]|nr:MoxR family ATPase [Oscillospiraceae bacterium]
MNDVQRLKAAIQENMEKAVVGKGEVIDLLLTALIAQGHVLLEDVPGLGKTTIVSALAKSIDCSFSRIQFTPDVLPGDITGYTMPNLTTGERSVVFGAVMAQVVLADEINRTSPKTQSALLEVMQENQLTIDGVSYPVPAPFMVLATQNPVSAIGTYPLPEAQLDRFLMKISLGYPTRAEEVEILQRHASGAPLASLQSVASAEQILAAIEARQNIVCANRVSDYIVSIAEATRSDERITLGVSPRGCLALMEACRAKALLDGREYVIPDDVQALCVPVLAHRLVLNKQKNLRQESESDILRSILRNLRVPGVS